MPQLYESSSSAKKPKPRKLPVRKAARTLPTVSKSSARAGLSATSRGMSMKQAKKTVRKVTRAAVRKGISGPTEDSLGITRQEGGRKIRRAVKALGSERATKVAAKTRLTRGQTYKGGKGWVSAQPRRKYGK